MDLDQHLVVIGVDSTAVRLVEELVRAGEQLVVLAGGGVDPGLAADLESFGAQLLNVALVTEAALLAAGVDRARAVVIMGDDDVFAVRVALAVEELNPKARLVLEMHNPNFGDHLALLLGECIVLSSAELAAPAFVSAALTTEHTTTFELGGRSLAVGPRSLVGGTELAVLGDTGRSGIDALLPASGDIVLGTKLVGPGFIGSGVESARNSVRHLGVVGAITRIFDRRLRFVLLGLVILIILSTLYFRLVGVDWLASVYLALTASTDTGLGDQAELPLHFRFGAVVIQLFGLVLSAGITAVMVDAIISTRFAALIGGVRGRPKNHVVVCGLGRVGSLVVERLHARGIPVVGVERHEDAVGVFAARRLKVPVIIAEASTLAAQQAAGIARAAVVLAVTDDDAVNLEIGLVAKEANADVRVVTRLFDHDLAGRVERRLKLGPTRSVSMLAAPAFAAAALGRRKEFIFPIGRRVLLFTEVVVQPASQAPGTTVADLHQEGSLKVLAIAAGEATPGETARWNWDPDSATVRAGDRLAVVATRAGLARLLLAVKLPTRR